MGIVKTSVPVNSPTKCYTNLYDHIPLTHTTILLQDNFVIMVSFSFIHLIENALYTDHTEVVRTVRIEGREKAVVSLGFVLVRHQNFSSEFRTLDFSKPPIFRTNWCALLNRDFHASVHFLNNTTSYAGNLILAY